MSQVLNIQVQVPGYQVDIEPQNLAAAAKFYAFAEIQPKNSSRLMEARWRRRRNKARSSTAEFNQKLYFTIKMVAHAKQDLTIIKYKC